MATTLGKLILELGIDDSKIAGQLADAKKKALTSATSVEKDLKKLKIQDAISTSPEIDNSEFSPKLQKLEEDISKLSDRIESKLNSLDASNVNKQLHLVPSVDHTPLEELNAHLDKKLKHVLTLNQEFALNPLRVNVDSRDLDTLTSKLNNIGNRTEKIAVTTEGIDDLVPLSEEDINKKIRRELDDTGVPTVSSQATSQKLQNTSKVNDLESVMSDLIQQNESLALSNQNLALAMRGLDTSINANKEAVNDMPVKMSKIIHTSSKETLMDKITGFPARAFETVVFGAFEGTGAQLAYDFVKGAQRYVEGKTGVDAETVGYNFGRYGYNRTKGLAMVGAEMFGYRGGLKEVGDDIAYLGRKLDEFIDPRKLIAKMKGFEDLIVGALEDLYVYNDKEAAQERVSNFVKAPLSEVREAGMRAAGVGVRAIAQPFRIKKRVQLARSMELAKELSEMIEVPDIENIDEMKSIALVSGGLDFDPEASSSIFISNLLKQMFGDKTATIPMPNLFMNQRDTLSSIEDFFMNTLGMPEPNIPSRFLYQAGTAGYSPDALAMEATRLAYERKYPDKKFIFAGGSGGTMVAEEATAIAERGGAKNVKGVGFTLGMMGLTPTADPKNFQAYTGELDSIFMMMFGLKKARESLEREGIKPSQKKLELEVLARAEKELGSMLGSLYEPIKNLMGIDTTGFLAPTKNTNVYPGIGIGHNFAPFAADSRVQEDVRNFLGDYIDYPGDLVQDKGMRQSASFLVQRNEGDSAHFLKYNQLRRSFGMLSEGKDREKALEDYYSLPEGIRKAEEVSAKITTPENQQAVKEKLEGFAKARAYSFVTPDKTLRRSYGLGQITPDIEGFISGLKNLKMKGSITEDAEKLISDLDDFVDFMKSTNIGNLQEQMGLLFRSMQVYLGDEYAIKTTASGEQENLLTPERKLKTTESGIPEIILFLNEMKNTDFGGLSDEAQQFYSIIERFIGMFDEVGNFSSDNIYPVIDLLNELQGIQLDSDKAEIPKDKLAQLQDSIESFYGPIIDIPRESVALNPEALDRLSWERIARGESPVAKGTVKKRPSTTDIPALRQQNFEIEDLEYEPRIPTSNVRAPNFGEKHKEAVRKKLAEQNKNPHQIKEKERR